MKKVYIIGPSKELKGGIATVINQIVNNKDISQKYIIKDIATIKNNKINDYVRAIIKVNKIEYGSIVHINMASNGSFFRKALIIRMVKKRCKIVIHIHGGYFYNFYMNSSLIVRKYIKKTLESADKIICVSNYIKDNIEKIIDKSDKTILINNSIKLESIDINLNTKENILLFMGKLIEYKGIFDLLKVVKEIKEQLEMLNWKVYIAGEGNVKEVERIINKYNLEKIVYFIGWISGDKKLKVLQKTKILLMPSYIESFGISCVEAMKYGNAIICTNIGGLSEIVKQDINGELFTPGDIEGFKRKIIRLITNDQLLAEYAYNNMEKCKEFAEEKMIKKINNIYDIL